MSLLQSIKCTLKNVQDDITGSLKSLTVSPEKARVPESDLRVTSTVNYDAGADILHRNEKLWKDLYQFTEDTSKCAQDVDIQIGNMYVYCDRQSESLFRLHNEASRLPTLISQLQEITNSLALVEEEYDKVEAALVHLEDLCEEQTYRKNVVAHHKQLTAYKMKKEHELQRYKVHLAREHAHNVQQVNKKRQHLLHEKQAAFDEQFAKDVDYFKKHGKHGRLAGTPESEKKLDLSEIEIDEDPEALDAFLGSADNPHTDVKDNTEENTVEDNEGPNIETILDITSSSETELSPEVTVLDTETKNVEVIQDITRPPENKVLPEVTVLDTEATNQSASATDLPTEEISSVEVNQSCSQNDSVAMTISEENDRIDTENHSSPVTDSTSTNDAKE